MRKFITLSAGLLLGCTLAPLPVTRAGPPDAQRHIVLQAPPVISVNSVAVSPDGSLIGTGAEGVRLYDARTGALLRALGGSSERLPNAA